MSAVLRQRAMIPSGSGYYVACSSLSAAIFMLSNGNFVAHSAIAALPIAPGTVMKDMGVAHNSVSMSSVADGVVYHKVKFLSATDYSAPDAYVNIVDSGSTSLVARLG